jgi:DNA-binding transcriptional MerR regulator
MVQGQAHTLTIGELARSSGLKTSTLRYYERRGVLPLPRRLPNGYRVYGEQALTYLRLIRQARRLGITLKEARQLVDLVQRRQSPCRQVHALVAARLRHVEVAIGELEAVRDKLATVWKRTRPGRCPATDLCPS